MLDITYWLSAALFLTAAIVGLAMKRAAFGFALMAAGFTVTSASNAFITRDLLAALLFAGLALVFVLHAVKAQKRTPPSRG